MGRELANHRRFHVLPSRKDKLAKGKPMTFTDMLGRGFNVPAKHAPVITPVYRLEAPGLLVGRSIEKDDSAFTVTIADFGTMDSLKSQYPLWNGEIEITFQPWDIARLVAKICLGQIVYSFQDPPLLTFIPEILIGNLSPQQLVGCVPMPADFPADKFFRFTGTSLGNGSNLLTVDYAFYGKEHDQVFRCVAGLVSTTKDSALLRNAQVRANQSHPTLISQDAARHLSNLRRLGLAEQF